MKVFGRLDLNIDQTIDDLNALDAMVLEGADLKVIEKRKDASCLF